MEEALHRERDRWDHEQNKSDPAEKQRTAGGQVPNTGRRTDLGTNGDSTLNSQHTVTVSQTQQPVAHTRDGGVTGVGNGPQVAQISDGVHVLCGPLLNYKRMSGEHTDNPIWHGTVLIVTSPGQMRPELRLRIVRTPGREEVITGSATFTRSIKGVKLYEDPKAAFWRFTLEVPFQAHEATWEYDVPGARATGSVRTDMDPSKPRTFAVPAKTQSMRIMFHSCNGFSAGTDIEAWSGCALWNDVLRVHAEKPFHVMIGGGDQVYNDGVSIDGPLKPWSDVNNPRRRRDFPFNEELRAKCDDYYLQNYIRWYSTEPFAAANSQVPQLNIWDDHDIIDGFGSYTDHFMQCAVFRGIGGVAHKYYLLFQHHIPPPKSTFTTDAPRTQHANAEGTTAADAVQLRDSWVLTSDPEDPSFIIGKKPGPYVEERSRSIYCQLGARIAFLGIDARTERTRHQVNYPQTYDAIFARASSELAASKGALKHLILLLGVPIAYPRLQWLENVFKSPIIAPIRFLNKRFGLAGSFFNQFDGNVDLLDDLDDHYTARQHKAERRGLIQRLQALAKTYSIRVTILGGDVHLAALGRFYSNPALRIPVEHDWRYMANVISSAITNKPPPSAVANLLARRNKIHHLDHETDETLLNLFDRDPAEGSADVKNKSADKNYCTMPSRNYAIIAESGNAYPAHEDRGAASSLSVNTSNAPLANGHGHDHDYPTNGDKQPSNGTNNANGNLTNGAHHTNGNSGAITTKPKPKPFPPPSNPRSALHAGEARAGTTHAAASGIDATGQGGAHGLDVTFRVEISPADPSGRTAGYGLCIPGLDVGGV